MCNVALAVPPLDAIPCDVVTVPVVTVPPPTIGEIFRQYGPAYRKKYAHRMSQDQRKAMAMLERCRTGELGSVRYHCKNCQRQHFMPRSCGNRHCPVCQGHKAKEWLRAPT